MKGKFPITHNDCGQVIYYHNFEVVEGMRISAGDFTRISKKQPYPVGGGRPYCHICEKNVTPDDLLKASKGHKRCEV